MLGLPKTLFPWDGVAEPPLPPTLEYTLVIVEDIDLELFDGVDHFRKRNLTNNAQFCEERDERMSVRDLSFSGT